MPVQMFWIGGEKVPMSGRHFLTYRAENSGPAEHTFATNREPLVEAVAAWLGERGLR